MKAEGRTVEEPGLFVSQLRWLFFGSTFAGMCFKTFGQVWTNPMSGKPVTRFLVFSTACACHK